MSHKHPRDYSAVPLVSRREAKDAGLKQYFTGGSCKEGHVCPRYTRSNACVMCLAERALAWQKHMYETRGDEYRLRVRAGLKKNPARYIFAGTKARANKRGIEFTITEADVSIPSNCPCCDRQLNLYRDDLPFKKGPNPSSPSIDRIDSALGYVSGNVAVICWRCNELKRNASVEELRTILAWLEKIRVSQVSHPILQVVRASNG